MVTRAYLRYAREGQNVTQAGPKCHTSRAKMSHKGQNVTQSCYNMPQCVKYIHSWLSLHNFSSTSNPINHTHGFVIFLPIVVTSLRLLGFMQLIYPYSSWLYYWFWVIDMIPPLPILDNKLSLLLSSQQVLWNVLLITLRSRCIKV